MQEEKRWPRARWMDGVIEMIEHKGLCNAGGKEMAKS